MCPRKKKLTAIHAMTDCYDPTMNLNSQTDLEHSIYINYACSHSHVHQVPFPLVKENIPICLKGMFLVNL